MTIDEALSVLEAAGLEVSAGPDGISAAADPRDPQEIIAKQGVRVVYDFGFGVQRVRGLWFLRHGDMRGPSEEETGLPKNCRAIVQANIDGYRAGKHTADQVMASLERNCGINGYAWGK